VEFHGNNSCSRQTKLLWFTIGVEALSNRAPILRNTFLVLPLRDVIVNNCESTKDGRGLHWWAVLAIIDVATNSGLSKNKTDNGEPFLL
jgi:hypothetical protein